MRLSLLAAARRMALRVLGDPFHSPVSTRDVRHPERVRRRQLDDDVAREERRADLLARQP